jgi:hypothetical protein
VIVPKRAILAGKTLVVCSSSENARAVCLSSARLMERQLGKVAVWDFVSEAERLQIDTATEAESVTAEPAKRVRGFPALRTRSE